MNATFELLVMVDDPLRKQAVIRLTLNRRPPTRAAWPKLDAWAAHEMFLRKFGGGRKAQFAPLTEAPARPLDCELVPTA